MNHLSQTCDSSAACGEDEIPMTKHQATIHKNLICAVIRIAMTAGLVLCMCLPCTVVAATNAVWKIVVPLYEVRDADPAVARAELEKLSRTLDPAGRGIRIVASDRPSTVPGYQLHLGFRLKDIRLDEAVRWIAKQTGHSDVRIVNDVALLCDRQDLGQGKVRTAALFGTVVDSVSARPITNATFKTIAALGVEHGSRVHFSPDGSFAALVEYSIRRPICFELVLYEEPDDTPELVITAPGYEDRKVRVFLGDAIVPPSIDVKLTTKKNNSTKGHESRRVSPQ